jgi:hypothetical protein
MTRRLNAVLGSLIVTIGFWITWGELSPTVAAVVALAAAGFLVWRGRTIAMVWAWATLLLGIESLSWPVVTMVRTRLAGPEPTDEQMTALLASVVFGLFSAVFWITFSYGIFRWTRQEKTPGA